MKLKPVYIPGGDYFTAPETAVMTGLDRRAVLKFCKDGRLPGAVKTGIGWLIPAESVAALIGDDRATLAEAQAITRLSRQTLTAYIRTGHLAADKYHGAWRIERAALENLQRRPTGRPAKQKG